MRQGLADEVEQAVQGRVAGAGVEVGGGDGAVVVVEQVPPGQIQQGTRPDQVGGRAPAGAAGGAVSQASRQRRAGSESGPSVTGVSSGWRAGRGPAREIRTGKGG